MIKKTKKPQTSLVHTVMGGVLWSEAVWVEIPTLALAS